ncbi:Flp family type IVb pilin [Jannaschia seohaensis]|uniref:Pilus assembly protein Flp/PilA n=1 Tax=Jannaschia seohaensis TaxID=475081 RepID=A0A2Y9AJ62_9RHOB|nr:hypothetical protein [Jannaschia seohaensis]PWJ20308.1 hypothetical protein BCF38_103123 [Jannaschia seohaensis]SSA44340.1 hypothetical protein SAMN05421539_103123 [Jannaschia seohaensis]
MKNLFTRLISNERGLTLPEYGIGLALAIGVGVVALGGLGDEITEAMTGAGNAMPCGSESTTTGEGDAAVTTTTITC